MLRYCSVKRFISMVTVKPTFTSRLPIENKFLFISFNLFSNRIFQLTRTSTFSVITRKFSVVNIRNMLILKTEITV